MVGVSLACYPEELMLRAQGACGAKNYRYHPPGRAPGIVKERGG
jgi:hypothetical protein